MRPDIRCQRTPAQPEPGATTESLPKSQSKKINNLSPCGGPLSQVIAVPLPPPEKKHKFMPNRQLHYDLFTVVRRNLILVLGAVRKAAVRYQPFGEQRNEPSKAISAPHMFPMLSFFHLFY